jgi:hypothetical protein
MAAEHDNITQRTIPTALFNSLIEFVSVDLSKHADKVDHATYTGDDISVGALRRLKAAHIQYLRGADTFNPEIVKLAQAGRWREAVDVAISVQHLSASDAKTYVNNIPGAWNANARNR